MNKTYKKIISIFVVFVFIFVLGGCSLPDAPEEYTNYVYYDYHLMALKTTGRTTAARLDKDDSHYVQLVIIRFPENQRSNSFQ